MREPPKYICLLVVLSAWLLGLAGSASAQPRTPVADFTFVVPLQVKNLHPNIHSANVGCYVFATGQIVQDFFHDVIVDSASRPGPAPEIIGTGLGQWTPVVNGQLFATITVPVMATAGKDPGRARLYHCTILLDGDPDPNDRAHSRGGNVTIATQQELQSATSTNQWHADPNQPHQISVAGTITPVQGIEYRGPAGQAAPPQPMPQIKR